MIEKLHNRQRQMAMLAAIVLAHGLLLLLLTLPATRQILSAPDALVIIDLPASEPEPPITAEPEAQAALAAAAEAAIPIAVVVPEPIIRIETPEPEVSARAAAKGDNSLAGASDHAGEGSGNSSDGMGTGSGGAGAGAGGGGIVRARWQSGRIERTDYPPRANRAGAGGSVIVHFDVRADGTVHRCRVRRSSGHADIDETTCRLIEARFRYLPARNARGEPIDDVAGWRQDWWLEPRR